MEHCFFQILTCKLSCAHVNIAGQELRMQHKICLEKNTFIYITAKNNISDPNHNIHVRVEQESPSPTPSAQKMKEQS